MPYSCRTMSPILLQTINIFIATYLLSSGMGRCALTRSLYLVHSKSPTCTWQGPVLQLGLGTSTHLYRGDQGGRQCPWSLSYRWIRIKYSHVLEYSRQFKLTRYEVALIKDWLRARCPRLHLLLTENRVPGWDAGQLPHQRIVVKVVPGRKWKLEVWLFYRNGFVEIQ